MLRIHFSNRFETLLERLVGRLAARPRDPFAADEVLVPSAAVRRALTLALADAHGVCANVRFGFLAQWLWQQIARVAPAVQEASPFEASAMTWRVFAALGDRAWVQRHPRLDAYLAQADEVMRYELAGQLATLLEQYVTYRPDWLLAWQQRRPSPARLPHDAARADERWQAELWQRLTGELGIADLHPAAAFVEALDAGGAELATAAGIASQVHVFALPTMAPLHVGLLERLGRSIDVDVYLLNPCREYWFEIVDRRRLSHLARRGRDQGHEEGNRLLAAWGRQTQSHIDGLLEGCGDDAADDGDFVAHGGDALLARLHDAILELRELAPGSVPLREDDRSVEVHCCHSLTRELEVLHDRLLALFKADPTLRPGDVLVATPDLDAAAPLIDAVFGTVPRERRLAYAITGLARSRVNPAARALLALLALLPSRMTATEVFALLQQPLVARRFGFDDEALQRAHDALLACGVRWGLDARHRGDFGLPATPRHTWQDGLERLFLGYAQPDTGAPPFGDQLGAGEAEGSDAALLGDLWCFVERLRALHDEASQARLPAQWVDLLLEAIDDFIAAPGSARGDELEDLREVQAAVRALGDDWRQGGVVQALPLAVVRAALAQRLDDAARGGVPSGSVTFASMSSLRGLPFRVVCIVGLDDGAFPTTTRPIEFDLMALAPRRGDRQRRDDERNLFLDLLLAARTHLHLSYSGRSVLDNAPRPPSVLVSELLDVLVPAVAADTSSSQALVQARRRLVVEHPMQPFSPDVFGVAADPRVRSHDAELARALRHGLGATPAPAAIEPDVVTAGDDIDEPDDDATAPGDEGAAPRFFARPLPPPEAAWRDVTLTQLVEFLHQPCRYLLRRRLGLELQRDDEELQDDETFLADRAARSALARRLLPPLLRGESVGEVRRLALAGHEMPAGSLGDQQLDAEIAALARFAADVRQASAEPVRAPHVVEIEVDLDGERWRLHGALTDLRPSGLVRWRYDARRAGDLLDAWIHHLALCAAPPADCAPRTQWWSTDGAWTLRAPADARAQLASLLALYRRGLSAPLHFYPRAAWAYVEHDGDLGRARTGWLPSAHQPYAEGADPGYGLALRGVPDALDESFEALARQVFDPVREHLDDAG